MANTRFVAGCTALALLALTGGPGSWAADAPAVATADVTNGTTAAATSLLAKSAAALAKAPTLTAEFTVITTTDAPFRDTQEKGIITLSHPDSGVRIDINRFRRKDASTPWEATGNGSLLVSNGKSSWTLIRHPESTQYRQEASAAPERLLAGWEPLLQGFFPPAVKTDSSSSSPFAQLLGTRTWENGQYTVVGVSGADGEQQELYIGSDNLIHRAVITRRSRRAATGEQAAAKPGSSVVRDFALHRIRIGDAVPATQFAFTAPADAISLAPAKRDRAAASLLASGEVAPDFTVEDEQGRPIRLSDFRGKVVVLKFWATWCWSCRQSLPEVRALATNYADKDTVVLAVAIWDSRAAFRNWQAKNAKPNAPLCFVFDPALQGQDIATTLYRVSSTPTQYVIGRDGRITAAFAGYAGPSPQLEKAVKAAIALGASSLPPGGALATK